MPSKIFKLADTRYLAAALSNDTTHSGISTFAGSLGITTEGNKAERSARVLQIIFQRPDTDTLILQLLNYLYVENAYADTSQQNDTYQLLRQKVL